MRKIAVFGGTFNPVHIEHVRLAEIAVKELGLDKIIIMPTFIPPHKSVVPAPANHRIAMLKIAFSNIPEVEISDYEVVKQGKSYTYLTMEYFRGVYPDAELYFIVGGDMLNDFKTWKHPEKILSACTVATFGREDYFNDYSREKEYFLSEWGKSFVKINYVGKSFSSTKIRVYSAFSLPLIGLVPTGVEEYIKANALYTGDRYTEYVKGVLPPKRLRHTANVVITALQKVKELSLDEEKVRIAATLHDVAKYLDKDVFKDFSMPIDVPKPVEHAFLGAFVAEKVMGITDEDIIDAIRFHTSGKPNMSVLAKLIFVADMIEEDRDYEGVEYLRSLYEKEDFEKCFTECLKEEVIHLLNKKSYIYKSTLDAYDYYCKK